MLKIYIADLTHNYKTVSNTTMPLSAAYIKAYLNNKLSEKVDCTLFRYPDILIKHLKHNIPDVLMVSNYVWNEALSLFIVSLAKKINPGILTIMGGPNFSLDTEKQEEFMRSNSELDFYVVGEGEIPSFEIIRLFIASSLSINKIKFKDLDSCIYIKPDGSFYKGRGLPGLKNLNDIPSPWLSGYLDEFFDGKLAPLVETTRGCPFSCLYCVQGSGSYKEIRRFSFERIKEEIVYIAHRIKTESPNVGFLCIADSDFGMYEEDVKVSRVIKEALRKYGWPTFIDATTGNSKKRSIFQTMINLKDNLAMYNSVQSMNPVVLKNINRKNIDCETLKANQRECEEKGIRTLTETILSLPGETFESHRDGIFKLIDLGFKQFTNYQCMVLKGSCLETQEFRKKFELATNYRILPRNFGIYDGAKVTEVEEVVSSTSTLSFPDYLMARKLHLILIIYYNGFRFKPLIKFMEFYGIKNIAWLNELFENTNNANSSINNLFNNFLEETKNELFGSYQQCISFFATEENFQKLYKGEIGGNLIMKYFSLATFHIWKSTVEYAFAMASNLIREKELNTEDRHCLDELKAFMYYNLASGESSEQILSSAQWLFNYDIKAWIKSNYSSPLSTYKLKSPIRVGFYLPKERYQILKKALAVYGEDIIGKSQLVTRIQYEDQLRESETLVDLKNTRIG